VLKVVQAKVDNVSCDRIYKINLNHYRIPEYNTFEHQHKGNPAQFLLDIEELDQTG